MASLVLRAQQGSQQAQAQQAQAQQVRAQQVRAPPERRVLRKIERTQ